MTASSGAGLEGAALRDWYRRLREAQEKLVKALPDGSWVVLPVIWGSTSYAVPDTATKDRFVHLRTIATMVDTLTACAATLASLVCTAWLMFVVIRAPLDDPEARDAWITWLTWNLYIALALLPISVAQAVVFRLWLARNARRVPDSAWGGLPPDRHPSAEPP
jgi:hypothetical protein